MTVSLYRYNQFIKESKEDIDTICNKYGIKNYTINEYGSIDVGGDVNLDNMGLTKFPLKFNKVFGYFSCSKNKLVSLKGCPESIGNFFDCSKNNINSLKYCTKSIGDDFDVSRNILTSLNGFPKLIGESIDLQYNYIRSFEGFPEDYDGKIFVGPMNPVYEIVSLFPYERIDKSIYWINEFEVIRYGRQVVLDRLEEVFVQMNLQVPQNLKFKNYTLI